ncbi:TPA: restriction endonuclease [Klebsiella pneumoniae]|nr:restriction endonuclease [Klebsiella pneumoniae]
MWLFDIIKDGTLVDNRSYFANNGIFTNKSLGESISLNFKTKGQRTNIKNDESTIWYFLNSVSHDVENELSNNLANALILFNDREYEHNTYDGFITINGTDSRNFTLNTGNLIGFVKRGEYSLKVGSRFGDAFLRYIIADADGFLEMENIGGKNNTGGYEWLLAYLWNIKLKKAYRLGIPKTYITKKERNSRIRGTIDTIDYFRNNASGKYLCTYREHSYDSPATSLFIKAYETIEHQSFCKHTRNIYNAFITANLGVRRSRQEILRTPYFTNPFYNDYNILIDLSKKIINQEGSDFGYQQESSAFFFDISMLFEYFIRKLLKRSGIRMLSKFERNYEIPTGAFGSYVRKIEPDLVFENDGGMYVFDVKYKTFDPQFGVKREDIFQLHTYIGQYGNGGLIKGCGFIYPISENRWNALNMDKTHGVISDEIHQQGKDIPFYLLFLKIPNNSDPEFNKRMSEECHMFIENINAEVLKNGNR